MCGRVNIKIADRTVVQVHRRQHLHEARIMVRETQGSGGGGNERRVRPATPAGWWIGGFAVCLHGHHHIDRQTLSVLARS
jgi:hypothetical protein